VEIATSRRRLRRVRGRSASYQPDGGRRRRRCQSRALLLSRTEPARGGVRARARPGQDDAHHPRLQGAAAGQEEEEEEEAAAERKRANKTKDNKNRREREKRAKAKKKAAEAAEGEQKKKEKKQGRPPPPADDPPPPAKRHAASDGQYVFNFYSSELGHTHDTHTQTPSNHSN